MNRVGFAPEVLAPVGGREQLEAAVKSGADAVYFGASDFNARRNAENFTDADFLSAVRYCRVRGVKCYITLNTLLTARELPAFAKTLSLVAKSGADAVIVQDLAAAKLAKEYYPSLALHASTQMAVHNVSGAKLLEEYGFKRVVLARELSLKEIARIAQSVDAEIEVFVHGALCMGFSGLCYTSCMFGGRSANRGLCAQPCRLDFKNARRDHCLSLKDLSAVPLLEELAAAGVSSFKIEGRMKRPEYVAAAVNACRVKLSGGQPDMQTLKSVFSRGGFTDGYLTGRVNGGMFGARSKEDVTAAAGVLKGLKRLYDKEYKRVPLTMDLRVQPGKPASLTVSDGTHTAEARGAAPEKAVSAPLTPEKAEASLGKLGDTPYFCGRASCEIAPGLMAPASALNALRRGAVERLDALRAEAPAVPDRTEEILSVLSTFSPVPVPERTALRLRFRTAEQFFAHTEAETYILPAAELLAHPELTENYADRLSAELPVLVFPADEEKLLRTLQTLRSRGVAVGVAENIGALPLLRAAGLTPRGGMHLNITNPAALREYEALGCRDNTLSFELNLGDIASLRGAGKTGYIAYGHLPLMRFRSCPQRDERGCGGCTGEAEIADRRNGVFQLRCSEKRFSTLYNPVPLCAVGLNVPRTDFRTFYFTVEQPAQCRTVTETLLAGKKPDFPVTAGMYNKRLL